MFALTFLEGCEPLCKRYELDTAGQILVEPYPHLKRFTSHTEYVATLDTFLDCLIRHAAEGHCLLKGVLNRALKNESRAGSTQSIDDTFWLCLDIDGLIGTRSVDRLLDALGPPFSTTSYVLQYSSSMGVFPERGLSAHLFYLLSQATAAPLLKQYLQTLNFDIPLLNKNIRLNKSATALRYPLDITACQNDKLIYIADPVLGEGVRTRKITPPHLVKAADPTLPLMLDKDRFGSLNGETHALRNQLRHDIGLPDLEHAHHLCKKIDGELPLKDVGTITITGERSARGFVYFNFNGGDSWAYYTPQDDPEVIRNFKGEPPCLLKDVDLERFERLKKGVDPYQRALAEEELINTNKGVQVIVGINIGNEKYVCAQYDHDQLQFIDFAQVRRYEFVKHFCWEQHIPLQKGLPRLTVIHDPKNLTQWDPEKRLINLYCESDILRKARMQEEVCPLVPPPILALISHVLGNDVALVEHFLNWLAVIVQYKSLTGTAWIWTGTQGTGKGVLFNKVLSPIIGETYAKLATTELLADKFNAFLAHQHLVFVDEAEQALAFHDTPRSTGNVKSYITEKRLAVRDMYTNTKNVPNRANFIFASNKSDPIHIERDDRRFNVCPRQEVPLLKHFGEEWVIEHFLDCEPLLVDFANYLLHREADAKQAATIIRTDAYTFLVDLSEDSNQTLANYLRDGNRAELLSAFDDCDMSPQRHAFFEDAYRSKMKTTLPELLERIRKEEESILYLPDLALIFYYANAFKFEGGMRFSKMLARKGLDVLSRKRNGDLPRKGIIVRWRTV